MKFELIGSISEIEIVAVGSQIRYLRSLRKKHGRGRWRKLKEVGRIRLPNGSECYAELRSYEAHGIGKKEMKVKALLD
jgi:hypothetical protein